jgi:hypothetical protein
MVGAWPAAVADLETAAKLRPCAAAHARLAEGRLQLGDYDGARLALAAAQQAEDAAECSELPALEAEVRQRSAALQTAAALQTQASPEPEPEPEPAPTSALVQFDQTQLCQPCDAPPAQAGEYLGSLCWAPDEVWPSPLCRAPPGATVPLADWASALAARMPPDAAMGSLPPQVLDGLSFPYSAAWALRKLAVAPVGPAPFHLVVLGASARVEQRLAHTDDDRLPGGYWAELLHLCRSFDDAGMGALSLVLHLVGPEVATEAPQTVKLAAGDSLRIEYHASDALSFIEDHPTLFQRDDNKPADADATAADGQKEASTSGSGGSKTNSGSAAAACEGWRCLTVAYHPGFGTGDPRLLNSWLPAVRQLVLLGVPTVCTCPNMVVDGAGEVAVLAQAFAARVINLSAGDASTTEAAEAEAEAEAVANPFAGPSLHKERDASGLVDLSWCPNRFIYAFAGRVEGAGPMPELEEHNSPVQLVRTDCSGLQCMANHALMFAKMRRVADQLR